MDSGLAIRSVTPPSTTQGDNVMTRRASRPTLGLLASIVATAAIIVAPMGALAQEPAGEALPTPTVPTAIVGDWFMGTIHSFQMHDPGSYQWDEPNGHGFYFIFGADGSYREGAVISETDYTCRTRLMGENQGSYVLEPTTLWLNQVHGFLNITNNCGDSGAVPLGAKSADFGWAIGPDELGVETLTLTKVDGTLYGSFHRVTG
jgi:hypothetical protein